MNNLIFAIAVALLTSSFASASTQISCGKQILTATGKAFELEFGTDSNFPSGEATERSSWGLWVAGVEIPRTSSLSVVTEKMPNPERPGRFLRTGYVVSHRFPSVAGNDSVRVRTYQFLHMTDETCNQEQVFRASVLQGFVGAKVIAIGEFDCTCKVD